MTMLTTSYTQARSAADAKVEAYSLYRKFLAAEHEFHAASDEFWAAAA